MNNTSKLLSVLSASIFGLIFTCQVTYAASIAGKVQFTFGDVQVTTVAGETRALKKGDPINEGDAVITAVAATAQIKMQDGGFIAVRPNTNLKFDKFIFHGKVDGEERSYFSLIKGGFRAVTGMIGKVNKQNYSIKTTTATIGVRGTDHETFFVPEGNASIPSGAYSKVNVGETTLTTNRGTVNVLPNQMGFAGNINQAPKIVPINTNLFTVAAAPTKTIKQSKAEQASQAAAKPAASTQSGGAPAAAATGGSGTQSGGAQTAATAGGAADNSTASADANANASTSSSTNTNTSSNSNSGSTATSTASATTTSATSDPTSIRTEAMDTGTLSAATNAISASPAPTVSQASQLKLNVVQVIVPIIMTNASTGTVLNASTQSQTVGGVANTLTGTALTLAYCTNSPTTAGCNTLLPSLASCTTDPTISGCSAVLPTPAVCTSVPTTAGCGSVLPTLAVCTSTPTIAGCSAVLPTIAACTSVPTTAGCTAVLPTLAACSSAPTTAGCIAVLPTLATCINAPTSAGCSAVLAGSVGVSTAGSGVGIAAYSPTHLEVMTAANNGGWYNSMASPANMVYVTGGVGNISSSGALQSTTFYQNGGGSGTIWTDSVTGGTATSANSPSFALTGIQYGAWNGFTGASWTYSELLGAAGNFGMNLSDYIYAPEGYLDATYMSGTTIVGVMSGTFNYSMSGATAPKSSNGLAGTLDSAIMTANFTAMTVNATLGLTMPGNDKWGIVTAAMPITNNPNAKLSNFVGWAAPGNYGQMVLYHGVGAAVGCLTCGGDLGGAFTGQNYAGAIIGFNLYDNTGGGVSGYAALTRNYLGSTNTAVSNSLTLAPTGNLVVGDGRYMGVTPFLILSPSANTTINANNVLTNYSMFAGTPTTAITCLTCTSIATTDVANTGIYYGTWTAGSYTSGGTNTFATGSVTPSYWITGPEAGPLFLPQALIGSANYVFDVGQVSNSNGVAGTVLGTSALTLNFTNQSVGLNLDVNVTNIAGTVHAWNVSTIAGSEASLHSGNGIGGATFSMGPSSNAGGQGLLAVTVDGLTTTGAWANVNGRLTGNGLTGAIINFGLNGSSTTIGNPVPNDIINGVAAFVGPTQNISTQYQYVLMSSYELQTVIPVLGFYANNATRVTTDAAGNLTQFDTQPVNTGNGSNFTLTNVSATLTDQGTDSVSGISWGRWAGGTVNITDRMNGTVTTRTQVGSSHWITEAASTTPVSLPISGTFSYIYAGGTHPTDNLGNVGTLNSATVSANFTTQTVNTGVNATVNGATLNATATNTPIIQNTVFYASSQEPAASTSYLTVTCTGTCGKTGGTVIGKFTGVAATGVAMSYGLQNNLANGATVINGVAAFHR